MATTKKKKAEAPKPEQAAPQETPAKDETIGELTNEELPKTEPDVVFDETQAPGTGIDTNGDGDADQVTTNIEEDAHEAPKPEPFSYEGKVRLSTQHYDAVDKKDTIKLVKESHVREVYKTELLKQIEDDAITPPYADMIRKIIVADSQGQKYSGTLES